MLIKNVVGQHEMKTVKEMRSDRNKTKMLWNNIKIFKDETTKKEFTYITLKAAKLTRRNKKFDEFLSTVYGMEKLNNDIWNTESRHVYELRLETDKRTYEECLQIMNTYTGLWNDCKPRLLKYNIWTWLLCVEELE